MPTPPRYDGTTDVEKRAFISAYQDYWFQCAALSQIGFQPYVMPISACIAESRRNRIAKYDLRKPAEAISEDEWIAFFRASLELGTIDFAKLDQTMQSLRLNTSFTKAEERISKLAHDMDELLDKIAMTPLLDKEPKRIVNYFVQSLAPPDFKATVVQELSYYENKALKADVKAFLEYCCIDAIDCDTFIFPPIPPN